MRRAWLTLLLVPLAACGGKRIASATAAGATRPANRPPVIRARCEPCTVAPGAMARVRVEAQDPDGDALTFTWRAPAGTIATPRAAETAWTAPPVEGPVFLTVRVEDGKGGSASDVITVTVTK
jgi:hypothetical protein